MGVEGKEHKTIWLIHNAVWLCKNKAFIHGNVHFRLAFSALSSIIKDIHLKLCLLSYVFKNQYALKIYLVSTIFFF